MQVASLNSWNWLIPETDYPIKYDLKLINQDWIHQYYFYQIFINQSAVYSKYSIT